MDTEEKQKRIFISYEWKEQEWVKDLAKSLRSHYGIDVILDIWDLEPGQDAYKFMESMVTDKTIDNVLVICSPEYKDKADNRTGGVGAETQIITPEIYEEIEQTKIVAVIPESGSKNSLPTYLRSRIYIDFSAPGSSYSKEMEKLARHIYGKPKEVAPPLGKIIDFDKIDQESLDDLQLKQIAKQIEESSIDNGRRATNLFSEFKEEYFSVLRKIYMDIDDNEEFSDEVSIKNIHKTNILVDYLLRVVKNLAVSDLIDYDLVIEFVDDHFKEVYDLKKTTSYKEYYVDHIYFMMHKGFLIICTYLFKYEKFEILADITKTKFYDINKHRYVNCGNIKMSHERLESRGKRLGEEMVVLYTELLKKGIGKELFKSLSITDLLLFYVSKINPELEGKYYFPITYLSIDEYYIPFFKKFQSRRHYEKVKCLFGMELTDFKNLLCSKEIGGGLYYIPRFVDYIGNVDSIGSEI
ncbi:toll/interleukin-1 receptor domain-containing protein [Listeria monocytogenes]|nr:toll/interleukin-1 receptor domain-containing protein [Listeria monocytogenes]